MDRKKVRFRITGNKHYHWNTLVFFLSYIIISGSLMIITCIWVMVRSASMDEIMMVLGENIIQKIILYSLAMLSVSLFIALLLVLIYANKIAGPLYRLRLYLHDMLENDFQKPLKFRTDDEFQDLAVAVNLFREKLLSKETINSGS